MTERVGSIDLRTRVNKAFRVRGDALRQVYFTVRKAERFFRDAPRRAALRRLPESRLSIPGDAGFLALPPGCFSEVADVVADARLALARYDESAPLDGKN